MPNLRIVTDNVLDRATGLSATSTAGTLGVANLLNDTKSLVWRSTGITTNTLTFELPAPELVGCVVLPYTNGSPTALIRVRVYADLGFTQTYDSGTVLACPAPSVKLRGFTPMQAALAYAWGGGACMRHWFPSNITAQRIVVDLADPGSLNGFIEAARLVVGPWWSPQYNFASGAGLEIVDRTVQARSAAGDQLVDAGTRNRKMTLSLNAMPASDRAALYAILRSTGMTAPVFVSAFPGVSDLELERDYQLYGRWGSLAAITVGTANSFSNTLDLQEV